jgi:hypothetical protein
MPYSSLFGFSRVKNIWVKIALGVVKNNRVLEPELHLHFWPVRARKYCSVIYCCPSMLAPRYIS